jgi:hypothetical protein
MYIYQLDLYRIRMVSKPAATSGPSRPAPEDMCGVVYNILRSGAGRVAVWIRIPYVDHTRMYTYTMVSARFCTE